MELAVQNPCKPRKVVRYFREMSGKERNELVSINRPKPNKIFLLKEMKLLVCHAMNTTFALTMMPPPHTHTHTLKRN